MGLHPLKAPEKNMATTSLADEDVAVPPRGHPLRHNRHDSDSQLRDDPETPKVLSSSVSTGRAVIEEYENRKYRDLFCVIFFIGFWGLVIFIILYYNIIENASKGLILIQPKDRIRRICGRARALQADVHVGDYVPNFLLTKNDVYGFCNLTLMSKMPQVTATSCGTLFFANGSFNTTASREFFYNVSLNLSDMTGFQYGLFDLSGFSICISNETAYMFPGSPCNPPQPATYASYREFSLFATVLSEIVSKDTAVTDKSVFDIKNYQHLPYLNDSEYARTQFFLTNTPGYGNYSFLMSFVSQLVPWTPPEGVKPASDKPRDDYILFPGQKAQEDFFMKYNLDIAYCMRNYSYLFTAAVQQAARSSVLVDYTVTYFNNIAENFYFEVTTEWKYIVGGVIFAFVFSLVYVLLVKFFVHIVVWVLIVGTVAGLLYGGSMLIIYAQQLADGNLLRQEILGFFDPGIAEHSKIYKVLGAIVIALGCLAFVLVLIFIKAIAVATAVLAVASDAISRMFHIIVVPVIFAIFVVIHLAWSVAVTLIYYSTGDYNALYNQFNFYHFKYSEADPRIVVSYTTDWLGWCTFFYLVFAVIWGSVFLFHCMYYVISSMVAQWYFVDERTRKHGFNCKVRPFTNAFRFLFKSTGTVCATSFVVAVIIFIRVLFEFLMKRMKALNGASKIVRCITCYIRYYLKYLQKFLQYISKNTIVYASITGEGYIKSTLSAVGLLLSKLGTTLTMNVITIIFLFFSKCVIALAAGVPVGFLIRYAGRSMSYFFPALVTTVAAFIISFYSMTILDLVTVSIFLCYLYEDKHFAASRSSGGPVYAPALLRGLLSGGK